MPSAARRASTALRVTYLTEEAGNFLAAVTWMGFGALAIDRVLPDVTWRVLLYAAVSLTVVRMLPVAIALARTGARGPTIAFMGWFGPRGLASVVFGLLALEDGSPGMPTSSWPWSWSPLASACSCTG